MLSEKSREVFISNIKEKQRQYDSLKKGVENIVNNIGFEEDSYAIECLLSKFLDDMIKLKTEMKDLKTMILNGQEE